MWGLGPDAAIGGTLSTTRGNDVMKWGAHYLNLSYARESEAREAKISSAVASKKGNPFGNVLIFGGVLDDTAVAAVTLAGMFSIVGAAIQGGMQATDAVVDGDLEAMHDAAVSMMPGPGGLLAARMRASNQQNFTSFSSFKRAMGPAGLGMHWHHIVEQTPGNVSNFGARTIHSTANVVPLDASLHIKVSSFYSSKNFRVTSSTSLTVRQWLSTQSFEEQSAFGLRALENISKGLW